MATLNNTTITIPSTNGSYDGDMAVKQYTTLTVTGTVTTSHHGRGLTIYVQGDCAINGTLSVMPSNSTSGISSTGINYPIINHNNETLDNLSVDGLGNTASMILSKNNKYAGKSGSNFHLDRNGSGDSVDEGGKGGQRNACCWSITGGAGGNSIAFSGGGGDGGGPGCHGSIGGNGGDASGGNGAHVGCHGGGGGGGGAGLPSGSKGTGSGAQDGDLCTKNGTLFLIVGGNLSGSGSIDLRGANGGRGGDGGWAGGGGAGAGGGVCFIAVAGTNTFCSNTNGTSTSTHSGGTGNILLSGGSGGSAGSGIGPCTGYSGNSGYCKVVDMI